MKGTFRIFVIFVMASCLLADVTKLNSKEGVDVKFNVVVKDKKILGAQGELIVGATSADEQKDGEHGKVFFRSYGKNTYFLDKSIDADNGISCELVNKCTPSKAAPADCSGCTTSAEKKCSQCIQGTSLMRFETQKLDESKTYESLTFQIVQDDATFPDKNGRIELGPNNPFWDFIVKGYEKPKGTDYFETSIYYKDNTYNPFEPKSEQFTDSKFVFNGRVGSKNPTTQEVSADLLKHDGWVWEGANLKYPGKIDGEKTNICVLDDQDALLIVNNKDSAYANLIKNVNKQLCGKDDCSTEVGKPGYSVGKVEKISFEFSNDKGSESLEFEAKEFIYENSDNTKNMIMIKSSGDVVNFSQYCGDETKFAVGRLFLFKSEFIVRKFDDKFQIGFNGSLDKSKATKKTILVLLGILAFAIIVAVILLKTCKRKDGTKVADDGEDEEGYAKAD